MIELINDICLCYLYFGILINYNGKKCIIKIQNINIEKGRYNNVLVMRRWMFCNIMYV